MIGAKRVYELAKFGNLQFCGFRFYKAVVGSFCKLRSRHTRFLPFYPAKTKLNGRVVFSVMCMYVCIYVCSTVSNHYSIVICLKSRQWIRYYGSSDIRFISYEQKKYDGFSYFLRVTQMNQSLFSHIYFTKKL